MSVKRVTVQPWICGDCMYTRDIRVSSPLAPTSKVFLQWPILNMTLAYHHPFHTSIHPSIPSLSTPPTSNPPLLRHLARRDGIRRPDIPVPVVDLEVLPHELPLPRLVGQVSPDLVAVLLGLQQGDEVDAGPHLLAGVLAARNARQFTMF